MSTVCMYVCSLCVYVCMYVSAPPHTPCGRELFMFINLYSCVSLRVHVSSPIDSPPTTPLLPTSYHYFPPTISHSSPPTIPLYPPSHILLLPPSHTPITFFPTNLYTSSLSSYSLVTPHSSTFLHYLPTPTLLTKLLPTLPSPYYPISLSLDSTFCFLHIL